MELKLAKGYESRILDLNSEVLALRRQNQQLAIQNGRVRTLLIQSNKLVEQKSIQLNNKQNTYKRIEKENEELQKLLQKSQRHRKIMYDHLEVQQPKIAEEAFLLHQLYSLSKEYQQKSRLEIEQLLLKRNKEITTLYKQYNELKKSHIKSTSQYQIKIAKLKQENQILKKDQIVRGQLNSRLGKLDWRQTEELSLVVRSLNERIDILEQKVKTDAQLIKQLRKSTKQVQIVNNNISRNSHSGYQYMEPQVERYLQMVEQNRKMREQLDQMNKKYEKLTLQLPDLLDREQEILQVLPLIKETKKKADQISILQIKLQTTQDQLQVSQTARKKLQKDLYDKKIQFEKAQNYHKSVVQKFKEFFKMVNPHFAAYQYSQLELSVEEYNRISAQTMQDQPSLKLSLAHSQQQVKYLQAALKQKRTEAERWKNALITQVQIATQIKESNDKLIQKMKKQSEKPSSQQEAKFTSYLISSFTQVQQQRNKLIIILRQREMKIVELVGQNFFLKSKMEFGKDLNPIKHLQNQIETFEEKPSLVFVDMGNNYNFEAKIQQLQLKIKQETQKYNQTIQQIRGNHLRQITTLKQKLIKAQSQNQALRNKVLVRQPSLNSQANVAQPMVQESGTMLELQQNVSQQQDLKQVNVVTPETIEQMSLILKNHETSTKNLVEAYNQLKSKYTKIQSQMKAVNNQKQVSDMRKMLEEYVDVVKALKTRLIQSDKNIVLLQDQLKQRSDQIAILKQTSFREKESLQKCIEELKREIEERKQQNWMHSDSPLQTAQKTYFPEELEYLIEQVILQEQKIKSLKKIQKTDQQKPRDQLQSQENAIVNPSTQWMTEEQKEFSQLIRSGRLMSILEKARSILENVNNIQQQ